jgi:hypothetical protein
MTVSTKRGVRVGVLSATALALLATACTSSGSPAPTTSSPTPPTTSSPAPTPKPKPTPKAKPKHHHHVAAVNPLTGIGKVPKGPVIAVKIDDTAPGRPQVGIDRADVVYIEAVEGGLTRLAAIFGTYKPTTVGYVRSTRPSDPDLLLQYGKITEAYSGGAHDSLPRVHRSGIHSWSNDAGARFYRRVPRAASSYINLALNLRKVNNTTKTPRPHKIGWTFSKRFSGKLKPKSGYHVSTEVTGSYAHGTPVNFKYSKKLHKYVRYIGGVKQRAADGKPIAATNVIVQACKIRSHPRDTDVLGNPSQFTYTVGKGPVVVFRGGHRIYGTWRRGKLKDGTVLRGRHHMRIPLAPGNTWVVLIRKGVRVNGQRA